MKSEVKIPDISIPKINFPLLARSITGNRRQIVLFINETSGFRVADPQYSTIGSGYETPWVSIFDKSTWEILPKGSQVILTQE